MQITHQAAVAQMMDSTIQQAPVVQKLDSAIHRINHYPADKYYGNQLLYLPDSDLSGGLRYLTFEQLGPGKSLSNSFRETN